MFTTVCKIDSKRIRDAKVREGITVGGFRKALDGCDVKDSYCKVQRKDKGLLIGRNDDYVLKDGDTLEFITRETKLPNLSKEQEPTGNARIDLANKLSSQAARELEMGTKFHRGVAHCLMDMAHTLEESADDGSEKEPSVKPKDDCRDKCGKCRGHDLVLPDLFELFMFRSCL